MPTSFFTFSPTEISGAVVIFNLLLASAICLFVAIVHKKTHSGLSYSHSFFATIVLVGVIATVILMVIQNNIFGAIGLLGVFALIRFRTIVKEPRDIAFIFFSITEGMAVGLNHYAVVIISTAIISLLAYVLSKFTFGSISHNKFVLLVSTTAPLDEESLTRKFGQGGVSTTLLSSKKLQQDLFEYVFSLSARDLSSVHKILKEASAHENITSYDLISGKDAIEY